MSDDSYAVIRKFENGWRWAIGFESDSIERLEDDEFSTKSFESIDLAQDDAERVYRSFEYGFRIEDDSRDKCPKCQRPTDGFHTCPLRQEFGDTEEIRNEACNCCDECTRCCFADL